ncbi:lytic transglycosylase domain-containing protein [Undibacterium griseum]|uniref:Lytic transglycosylase domain-containing protein n=1 Tax=Undibacterium griseum TaxID=2762295 RepID=A0ABR6YJR6_9BURK|nr:lytic transglycosylase domain-containing protein [Undibacterium griseum]MBC3884035.1 lytic transglycosylase domain-containing protein [Undibacterium griseum]
MFLKKNLISLSLVILAGFGILSGAAAATPKKGFITDDDRFMALRDAGLHDDPANAEQHAAALANYDIPSYVDYYRIRSHLYRASNTEIRDFISRYDGSAIADRMRNDWLLLLAKRGEWDLFDQQYPLFVVADDNQLRCYALLSKASRQQNVASDAKNLLNTPRDYGEGCYALVSYLYANKQLNQDDLWAQMRMAAENNSLPLALRLGKLLDLNEKRLTEAFDKPARLLKKGPDNARTARELYVLALGRMARTDTEDAAEKLSRFGARLNDSERANAWALIALQSALKLEPDALGYWTRTGNATLSSEALQWRIRTALREGDWKLVKNAITQLPPRLRNEPAWLYWYGRALKADGKTEEARQIFSSITDQIHFYGQLALEENGQKIGVPVSVRPVTAEELSAIEKNQNLQRALRFYAMNLRLEGTREWNWELRKMNERQHIVAAELARKNNLLDRMVNTSDRTREEMDFSQRFPTPFNDSMYKTTQALGLDMAWVYGLIRQESRFIMTARSHVGASGLMQIMPATARYVAKKMGLGNFVPEQVNDVETNIALGTNYLNMVLTDLGGSQALASAAYNAGPGRPRAWRAKLTHPVEGAIFTETIPFNETRNYVKNVLSNATYYAALFEKKPQSLKARLGTVVPKGMSASDAEIPDESNTNARY